MNYNSCQATLEILIVEDNPGDIFLTQETLKNLKIPNRIHVVRDGEEALAFLHQQGEYQTAPRPDIILLDLNLPKRNGREVLEVMQGNHTLKEIPVIVLTTSLADREIFKGQNLRANCYIPKPYDLSQFDQIVRAIEHLG
ncbi:response regulator [Capilliphycus salinus ALCB114379]|uniref:response regulator n=1 Tax=Capilliphycus salinus TaxID=2768948 RepID=UPI0039A4F01D